MLRGGWTIVNRKKWIGKMNFPIFRFNLKIFRFFPHLFLLKISVTFFVLTKLSLWLQKLKNESEKMIRKDESESVSVIFPNVKIGTTDPDFFELQFLDFSNGGLRGPPQFLSEKFSQKYDQLIFGISNFGYYHRI